MAQKKVSKPDPLFLKQAISEGKAEKWKKTMQVKYNILISNDT